MYFKSFFSFFFLSLFFLFFLVHLTDSFVILQNDHHKIASASSLTTHSTHVPLVICSFFLNLVFSISEPITATQLSTCKAMQKKKSIYVLTVNHLAFSFSLDNLFTLHLKPLRGAVCLKPVVCAGRSTRSGLWCCLYCVTVRSVFSDCGSRRSCSSVQAETRLTTCSSYGEDALKTGSDTDLGVHVKNPVGLMIFLNIWVKRTRTMLFR